MDDLEKLAEDNGLYPYYPDMKRALKAAYNKGIEDAAECVETESQDSSRYEFAVAIRALEKK